MNPTDNTPPHHPAFTLIEPTQGRIPVVAASPHSGRRYPQAFLDQTVLPLKTLRRSEDFMVDVLIRDAVSVGAPVLLSEYARTFLDLNRSDDELDPFLFADRLPPIYDINSRRVSHGLGVIHRLAATGEPIYDAHLELDEVRDRLNLVHRPYHAQLKALLETTRERFGGAILLDWHSMPSTESRADIVIGDRFTCAAEPSISRRLERLFVEEGLTVARNDPFAGGYVTASHANPIRNIHALQIEIRRDLYMDEATLALSPAKARALGASFLRIISGMRDALRHPGGSADRIAAE